MTDVLVLTGTIALFAVIFAVLYVWSGFDYTIDDGYLTVRWRLLGVLPFTRRRVALERILDVRRFAIKDLLPGFEIWGALFRGEKLVVVLDSGMIRRVYITPRNSEAFKAELLARAEQSHPK